MAVKSYGHLRGVIAMELLLALAGLGGLALLLQAKPLPSKADVDKATGILEKDPTDQDANTIVGKYKAFVIGDYDGAMPYLVHSSDKTLKSLAEHELDATYTQTAAQKVGMADEWVAAAKKIPTLSRIFYDRAGQWYATAWPDLDNAWKLKVREQGRKLSAARPAGNSRKGLPQDWIADPGMSGTPTTLDGLISRTGSYSAKLSPPDEKIKGSYSAIRTDFFPITSKTAEISAYVRTDGTENSSDRLMVHWFDQNGVGIGTAPAVIPLDMPFWNRISVKADPPQTAVRALLYVVQFSKKGNIWVDDVSVKFDNKEAIKNGSFEEK